MLCKMRIDGLTQPVHVLFSLHQFNSGVPDRPLVLLLSGLYTTLHVHLDHTDSACFQLSMRRTHSEQTCRVLFASKPGRKGTLLSNTSHRPHRATGAGFAARERQEGAVE